MRLMKRNRVLTFFTLLCGLLLYGCSSEEDDVGDSSGELPVVTLSAYIGTDGSYVTRTVMNSSGNLFWTSTDAVCVNGRNRTKIEIRDGGVNARFTVAAVAPYYVMYPVYTDMAYNSTTHIYTFDFPSLQPYGDNTSFASGVNPSVAASETADLYFRNVCGVLKAQFKVQLAGVSKIRFLSAGKAVAGSATVNPIERTLQITGDTRSMDVAFSSPRTLNYSSTLTVRWVLPVGDYEAGWAIQLLDKDDNVITQKVAGTGFTIVRSQVQGLGLFTYMSGAGESFGDIGNHENMQYNSNYYSFGDGNHEDMGNSNNRYWFENGGNHEGVTPGNTTLPGSGNHESVTPDGTALPNGTNHEDMGLSTNGYQFGGESGSGNHESVTPGNTTLPGGGNHEVVKTDSIALPGSGNHEGVKTDGTTLPNGTNHEGMGTSSNGYKFSEGGNHETVTPEDIIIEPE